MPGSTYSADGIGRKIKKVTRRLFAFLLAGGRCFATDAPEPAFAPVKDNPRLPRALLIGDSVSIAYTLPVRKLLTGSSNVHRPAMNCGPTTRGLEHIHEWLGNSKWDVIHFNWGLHDVKIMEDGKVQVAIEEYERNLVKLVSTLKQTGARLVWASTTPAPEGPQDPPRNAADVLRYNAAAKRVMDANGIPINDLYTYCAPRLGKIQKKQDVHFTDAGYWGIAGQVATAIRHVAPYPS
jgi:acyl-CoA thioesterase-1